MQKLVVMTAALGLLAACTSEPWVGETRSGDLIFVNAKSASDPAGGPRQDVLVLLDARGNIRASWNAAGPGTWQTMTEGAVGAAVTAGGMMGAAALLRPPVSNFTASNSSTMSGGNIAPGAAAATANPNVVATGGRGGTGGNATGGYAIGGAGGNAYAAGGNALAKGGNAVAASQSASRSNSAAQATARSNQTQNQGQWNCIHSPPCN